MLTGINGTIKIINNRIALAMKREDYEEFKKYENLDRDGIVIDNEFYVGFMLGGKQLYVTGSYPQEELGDNTIMNVKSVGKKGGKYSSRLEEMKNLLGLNDGKEEIMVKNLSKHPIIQKKERKGAENTELANAEQTAQTELENANQKVQAELETAKETIKGLDTANQKVQQLEKEKTDLADENKKVQAELETANQTAQTELANANKTVQAELETAKETIKGLEAKNKTIEQPKQGNGAKYTATVGIGLAVGLVAFIALERTVRLNIWVMVGIAVVSTAVAGSITYAVLPSAQADGAKAQGVNGGKINNKG